MLRSVVAGDEYHAKVAVFCNFLLLRHCRLQERMICNRASNESTGTHMHSPRKRGFALCVCSGGMSTETGGAAWGSK